MEGLLRHFWMNCALVTNIKNQRVGNDKQSRFRRIADCPSFIGRIGPKRRFVTKHSHSDRLLE